MKTLWHLMRQTIYPHATFMARRANANANAPAMLLGMTVLLLLVLLVAATLTRVIAVL